MNQGTDRSQQKRGRGRGGGKWRLGGSQESRRWAETAEMQRNWSWVEPYVCVCVCVYIQVHLNKLECREKVGRLGNDPEDNH